MLVSSVALEIVYKHETIWTSDVRHVVSDWRHGIWPLDTDSWLFKSISLLSLWVVKSTRVSERAEIPLKLTQAAENTT